MNNIYIKHTRGKMSKFNKMLMFIFIALFMVSTTTNAQVSVCTNFANNNGSGQVTFNFENTNAFAVIITGISSMSSSSSPTVQAWYKTTPINGSPGVITNANGWTQFGSGTASVTPNVISPFWNGTLSLIIPAGATYGISVSSTSLRYSTIAAGSYVFPGGGCNLRTGTNIGYGGTAAPSAATIANRGFIGCVTFVPAISCSGAPNAGTITSPASACPTNNFTITSSGLTFGTGITYQWQSASTCAGPWTNVPGATGANLTTSISTATSFRIQTTCAPSGLVNVSNCVSVTVNPFYDCYCTSTATSTADEEIFNVTFGTLNNSSTCATVAPGPGSLQNRYSNYKGFVTVPNVAQGQTVPFALTLGYCGSFAYSNTAAIYIDYNQNGSFSDAGELIYSKPYGSVATGAGTVVSGTTVIPLSATIGNTAMRVVFYETSLLPGPCGTPSSWGETEDYLINVIATSNCAGTPTPGSTLSTANPTCVGQSFTLSLSNTPSSVGNSYQWQTSPDNITWTNVPAVGLCNYIFRLRDSFGDGWNGATMQVRQGATVIATLGPTFTTGTQLDIPLALNSGVAYTLYYVGSGSWPSEVGIQILNESNTMIYNLPYGTGSAGTTLFSWSTNAGCPVPSMGPTYTTSQTVATWYRAQVTCTYSGQSGYSTPIHVTNQLCYCASSSNSTFDEEIFNVTVGSLNNSSVCGVMAPGAGSIINRYSNYRGYATVPNLTQATSYPVSVTVGECGSFAYSGSTAIFIDFNQNGTFEANERAFNSVYGPQQPSGTVSSGNIFIPNCATEGLTTMRVVYAEGYTAPPACGTYGYGETEDYNVNIVLAPVVPPVATTASGPATATCNTSMLYSVAPGYFNTLQWQYATAPGGPYLDIANATNANQTLFASGPATFYLRARFIGSGCVADAYSNEIQTVITSPVVNFTTSTPSTSICRGTAITLTATTAGPYIWNTGATTQSITVTPLVNTTYTIVTGSGLCTGAGTVTVDIIGGPIAVASVNPNTAVCPGGQINLAANQILGVPGTGYTGNAISYAPVSTSGTSVTLSDDQVSGAIPIGFNFTFFGIAYTQAYISSNGFITFNSGSPNGCCSGQNLPSPSTPNNLIALAWEDLNPGAGGTITYNTLGTAPNRKFVVSFNSVPHFGGGGSPLTGQIILNETVNTVELQINQMTSDGGAHTQGIENAAGNSAYTTPGRNASSWSATSSGYLFTPNMGQTFTYSGPVTYSWVGSNGFTSSSMNTVDFPTVPTTYTLTVADDVCSSSSETSALIHPTPSVTSFTGSPFCENSAIEFFTDGSGPAAPPTIGSLVVTISGSGFLDETGWQLRNYANVVIASGSSYGFGSTNNINVTPAASDYPVTFYIETQGTFNDNVANYSVYCNANSTMLVSGTATGGTTFTSSPYTCGGSAGGLQYNWTGPNGFTSTLEDPYIGSAQLTDNGTYTVVITDGNGCTESHSQTVIVNDNPEPYMALMSEVSCDGFNDGMVQIGVNGGTPFFSFYEASLGQQNYTGFYTGLYDGTYYFDVTDINGCFSPMPVEVVVTTAPNIAPVIACPADVNIPNDPGSCGAIVNYLTPVGTDVCPVVGTLQLNGLATGASFPIGTTVNTYEVTDVLGLTASCSFSVTVSDSEEPTILNCPSNFSSCNPITWTAPSITDNCLGLQVTSTHTPGTNFPFGTTTVTYTATDAYNNVSTCSFDVTRLEESVAADSITSNRDFNNICLGDDITLTINGGSLGEAAQWKWFSGSCGGTALPAFSGMASITVAPTVTTTYYARAEGLCNTTGCISITVVVSTAAPNGVVITSAPAIGAVGQSGVVTATNVPGATFYRWTSILGHINAIWFNGSPGPVETATNSVNVSFQIQQQNYQIRVVAGNACGRSNNASAHIRGTVEAATCLDGPVLACPLTTATYSVAACPIPGTSSYQWTIPSGDATITAGQGTNTISVTFGPGFTTAQVCVNGVSTFGLAGPTTCLTVSNSTEAPGAITGNDEPCQSGLENYTIAPVTGAVSYIWTTNIAGATASGTTTTGTVQFPSGPFSGQVCVQAVSGCGTSVASCYNVTSGAAGIPGPISGPVSGICGASNVNYALATNDANSYNWILPAGVTVVSGGTSNSVNVNFAPGLVGPQTITVEAFYNCGSATSSIIVDGAPATPTITPATICAGTDELYFASSAGADNYTWALTGADYEECTNGNCSQYYVIWNVAGGSLSVTASNSCGTSAPFNLSTNCRVSTTGNMDTKVYPNPTSGNLTIEFTSYAGGQYNLTVTDMAGRSFLTEDVKATSGLNQHNIDLGTANPGLYMLYLKDANGDISVHKITVE